MKMQFSLFINRFSKLIQHVGHIYEMCLVMGDNVSPTACNGLYRDTTSKQYEWCATGPRTNKE
jgi:hypothetical protein